MAYAFVAALSVIRFFVLYSSLVEHVCQSSAGFEILSDPEKVYYALTLFQDEVNNGGFHQFFFNGSGSYYDLIENGLATFDEPQTRELLHRAKEIVFAEMPVPIEMEVRRERMRECAPSNLDELASIPCLTLSRQNSRRLRVSVG